MEHNYRIASNVFFFCPSLFLSFYKRCNKQTAPRDGCRPRKWDIIINRRGATCGPDWRKCAQVSTVGWGESVYVYTIYPEETYFWYFHDDITAPFCLLFPCFLSLFLFLTSKKHKGNVFINTGHFAAAVRDESCFRWRERESYIRAYWWRTGKRLKKDSNAGFLHRSSELPGLSFVLCPLRFRSGERMRTNPKANTGRRHRTK